MTRSATDMKETPSQTAGPYVHIGMDTDVAGLEPIFAAPLSPAIAGPEANGKRIRVSGTVFDGRGEPMRDAVVEIWQADAHGIYNAPSDPNRDDVDPAVHGWGRVSCDLTTGRFTFDTIKPGPVAAADGATMAPHLNLWIVARGINVGLSTRLYFPEDIDAQGADPVLARVEEQRRSTLIAKAAGTENGAATYMFDIRVQGDAETVFFDA